MSSSKRVRPQGDCVDSYRSVVLLLLSGTRRFRRRLVAMVGKEVVDMCACVYVCMYRYMYQYMCMCTYVCTCICMYVYIYIYI